MAEILHITFTDADVQSIAEAEGVAPAIAAERAESWAKAIADTATTLINEQLTSVIVHDQP